MAAASACMMGIGPARLYEFYNDPLINMYVCTWKTRLIWILENYQIVDIAFNCLQYAFTLKVMPLTATLGGNEENVAFQTPFWWSSYVMVVTALPAPSRMTHGLFKGISTLSTISQY